METKHCLQLDDNGYLIGRTVADESPLEPGVFLLPAGAVDSDAPTVPDGKRAKWNGSGFDIEDIPQPRPEPVTEPAVPQGPPTSVTMRQARLALLQNGMLIQVNTAVAAMPGAAGDAARIEWEYAQEVRRDSLLLAELVRALDLTTEQLDELFTLAGGL